MSKFAPKPTGPSKAQKEAQAASAAGVKAREEGAQKQLSAASRAVTKRRTGRRLLLAPGREDELAQLGGGGAQAGGNF